MKKLDITKNPSLYSYPEVLRYNGYEQFVRRSLDQRKDRFRNLRTDDIDGASLKKKLNWNGHTGKKTKNFFVD